MKQSLVLVLLVLSLLNVLPNVDSAIFHVKNVERTWLPKRFQALAQCFTVGFDFDMDNDILQGAAAKASIDTTNCRTGYDDPPSAYSVGGGDHLVVKCEVGSRIFFVQATQSKDFEGEKAYIVYVPKCDPVYRNTAKRYK